MIYDVATCEAAIRVLMAEGVKPSDRTTKGRRLFAWMQEYHLATGHEFKERPVIYKKEAK